jgi:hypothetical protein
MFTGYDTRVGGLLAEICKLEKLVMPETTPFYFQSNEVL